MAQALAQKRAEQATKAEGRQARALSLLFAALELRLSANVQQAIVSGQAQIASRVADRQAAQRLIERFRRDFRERLVEVLEQAYGSGARLVSEEPESHIVRSAIATLTDGAANRLDNALTIVGRQVDDLYRRVALEQAARQITRELPEGAAADLLQKQLMRRGVVGFVDKAGRNWRLSTYSQMVIRTTTAEAVAQGTVDTMQSVGRDLVRMSAHKHPEDLCTPYDGKTFSLTGKTPGYPVLDRLPPLHPNCTHVIAPAPEPHRLEVVK